MSLPGFTAESSLRQKEQPYKGLTLRSGLARDGAVTPQFCYRQGNGFTCCYCEPGYGCFCNHFTTHTLM